MRENDANLVLFMCYLRLCCVIAAILTPVFHATAQSTASKPSELSVADRIAYQRAIEEVYWTHRIWPKERQDSKPSLDQVMPQAELEAIVKDYLRNSQALEDFWHLPITAGQLQAEIDRMAQNTHQPEVLRELFAALGNDPAVIAECLARPALAERMARDRYARDQRLHGDVKNRAVADLKAHPTLKEVKQRSENNNQIEWVKSSGSEYDDNSNAGPSVKMDGAEWDQKLKTLAEMFGSRDSSGIQTGVFSRLQEDDERFYATAVIAKSADRLKLAVLEWRKESFESWRAATDMRSPKTTAARAGVYTLPTLMPGVPGCVNDTWTPTINVPGDRVYHTAVWTGSEMIVWGGYVTGRNLNSGDKYNPATDSWTTMSTIGAPQGRSRHTAVWTGSEMVIWGGQGNQGNLNTGGRYNPGDDTWVATSATGAPTARSFHTAIWTGSEMIVCGGNEGSSGPPGPITCGRYNPGTDSWTATSTTNAPVGRTQHTAIWSGSEMIIWGGQNFNGYLNNGARYNPVTNSWTASSTTNAPGVRYSHTTVWTGSEMIVWGGWNGNALNTGGRYNPSADTWTPTSTTSTPSARYVHTAVWTGSEMIVWGGNAFPTDTNTGGKYNPITDTWTATSTDAPSPRTEPTSVWTGSEMIVFGGNGNTGGRYNPASNSWTAVRTTKAPGARSGHVAVWTGSEMIVWGGGGDFASYFNSGGRYNPATDSWVATTNANAPGPRVDHTALWTGMEMIVWGGWYNPGFSNVLWNTGGRYNPTTNSWIATNTTNAPVARRFQSGTWTGNEMIVWGGEGTTGNRLNTGGRYDPTTDSWTATNLTGAPTARKDHAAVWTGSELIIWGGDIGNIGGRYNPGADSWTPMSTVNAPQVRGDPTAIWTGSEMIVWGGGGGLSTGGRYNPSTDSWTATSTLNAQGRATHSGIWTGSEMIVWGGQNSNGFLNTGGRYNPATDTWSVTTLTNAPILRSYHTAIWTGSEMIVWGGWDRNFALNSGIRYCVGPMPQTAVSRKTHGAAGDFDVNLPLNGTTGSEGRIGGGNNRDTHQVIIVFAAPVTVSEVNVASPDGGSGAATQSVAGAVVTITLSGVADQHYYLITLMDVTDGITMANVAIRIGMLIGDTNGDGVVNASDVAAAKAQSGAPVSNANFRADVNANGAINASDVSIVKSHCGDGLP